MEECGEGGPAAGLLALLLLSESRVPARTAEGAVVLLRDQDRIKWDRTLIDEGMRSCVPVSAAANQVPSNSRPRSKPCTVPPTRFEALSSAPSKLSSSARLRYRRSAAGSKAPSGTSWGSRLRSEARSPLEFCRDSWRDSERVRCDGQCRIESG
jgi:hypothetical protein